MTEFNDDEMLTAIARWSSEERQQRATGSRMSSTIHRQLAQEEATFSGLMQDLAERRTSASIRLRSERLLIGEVVAVGKDFCAITGDTGLTTVVATRAITGVEIEGSARNFPTPSDRSAPNGSPSLAEVLAELAVDQKRIRFTTRDQQAALEGEVLSVGADICTLGRGSPISRIAFVPIDQIDDIALA